MIQAKIYAPTLEHHLEAVQLTKRSRAKNIFEKTVIVAICMVIVVAWSSDFAFPPKVDWSDLIVPLLLTVGFDLYYFWDSQREAKNRFETEESDNKQFGPRHYRATPQGVEWWWSNHHDIDEWTDFDRYRLTGDLLIVAWSQSGGYWVLPRNELSPQLLTTVIDTLRQSGAKEVGKPAQIDDVDQRPT
jgi:hypothetical protein